MRQDEDIERVQNNVKRVGKNIGSFFSNVINLICGFNVTLFALSIFIAVMMLFLPLSIFSSSGDNGQNISVNSSFAQIASQTTAYGRKITKIIDSRYLVLVKEVNKEFEDEKVRLQNIYGDSLDEITFQFNDPIGENGSNEDVYRIIAMNDASKTDEDYMGVSEKDVLDLVEKHIQKALFKDKHKNSEVKKYTVKHNNPHYHIHDENCYKTIGDKTKKICKKAEDKNEYTYEERYTATYKRAIINNIYDYFSEEMFGLSEVQKEIVQNFVTNINFILSKIRLQSIGALSSFLEKLDLEDVQFNESFMHPFFDNQSAVYTVNGGEYGAIRSGGEIHNGIDFATGGNPNIKIQAAASGKVVLVQYAQTGYGHLVVIYHGIQNNKPIFTVYGHCGDIFVSEGENVSAGKEIAVVGNTGNSTGFHLHFEIREGTSTNIDPNSKFA